MSNQQLVQHLIFSGVLKSPYIMKAFREVDRGHFVPGAYSTETYFDYPIDIGYGQTISQPTTVAIMLEELSPKPGERILDIGSGSGWTTALLSNIVGPMGYVFGVERVPELVTIGATNLARQNASNAVITQASDHLGLPNQEQFNRILVSAASQEFPKQLLSQLKIGGTIVIPVQKSLLCVTKTEGNNFEQKELPGFAFVPLLY